MKKLSTLLVAFLVTFVAFAEKGAIVLTSPVNFQVLAVSPNGKWACGISGDGVTSTEKGVLWNLETGEFTYLSTSGSSTAYDVADDGTVVGSGGYYKDGRWHSLGGQAMSISRDARTIVGYSNMGGGYAPTKWVDGKFALTYPYDNDVAQCYTVSDDGTRAAGWGYTTTGGAPLNRTIALWSDSTVEYLSPRATFAEAGRRFSPDGTKLVCETWGKPFVYDLVTKEKFNIPFYCEATTNDEICSAYLVCYVNNDGTVLGQEEMMNPLNNNTDTYAFMYDGVAGRPRKLVDWLKEEHGVEIDATTNKVYRGVEMSNDGKVISMLSYVCEDGMMTGDYVSIVVLLDREVEICPPVTMRGEKLRGLNSVRLTWSEPIMNAANVLGYNIYRDGKLIVSELAEMAYIDAVPAEGTYTYTATALYPGEGDEVIESEHAEPITVEVYAEPLNTARNIQWHAVNLNNMKLRWGEPEPNSPSFTYYDYDEQTTGFGGGVVSFSVAMRMPIDIVANYADEYVISRVSFMPRNPEAGYTIKVYVNGVEKSTQVVDNAVLSYNNMNTIDLSTPVEFESLDDVLVAIDIDASGFSVSSNDVIGMCYGMATPGYSDLLRQASEPEYYSLNQSSVNSGYGEFLVSWAISAVLSKLDENGKPNINCDIIESYEILRDDNKLAEVTTTDYFDTDITTGRHEYKILVHYADGSISEPARANINFTPKYEVLRAVNDVRVSIDDSADAMKAEWDAPLDNDATVLSYARGNSSGKGITKTGATELIEYTVAHEYPYTYFDWYEGYNITALRFYPTAEAVFAIVLEVDGIDQEMIVMEEMDTEDGYVLNRWNEVKLSNPHKIRAGENVRVKLVCAEVDPATYPITMDSGRGNVGVSDLYSFNYSTFSSAYSDGGLSGSWMLGLVVANDDTELLPVVGYNVELDGEQANSDLITETVFAKDGLGWKNAETHRIRVNTVFNVDNNERMVEGEQVVFNVVAGVERLDIDRVNVYPNPATSYIHVDGAVDCLSLYDMQGALVMEANANMLDVTTLPVGNYLLKISSNEGVRTVKILIVR